MTHDARIYPPPPGLLVPPADDDPLQIALDPRYVLPRRVLWWGETEPDRPFMTEVDGRSVSYGEAVLLLRGWAGYLKDIGVRSGDWVLSALPPSVNAYLLWMAASCVGACEVAVNPSLRGRFLRHVLTDSGATLCFAAPADAAGIRAAGVPSLEVIEVGPEFSPATDQADLGPLPRPADPSCVIYTSGTTGMPKGVILSWAQMAATIGRIPRSWLSGDDAAYVFHPMFHVTGRTPFFSMTDVGGRVVLRERFSASAFWDDVRRNRCTTTTSHVSLLLAAEPSADDRDNPLRVSFGSHSHAQSERFGERFGVHMVGSYGSTEAGFPLCRRWLSGEPRSGWLRRGYEARLVDGAGADVPDGQPGELWIRPPARPLMMLGYLGRDDLTSRAVVDGWYRTGDLLVRHPDGGYVFVDRIGDTIRRLGENISATALESVVTEDPEVLECAAIGVPDATAGHEPLLAVLPARGDAFDPAGLYQRLIPQLAPYMRPAYIVAVEDFPRTPTKKIRKTGLLDQLDLRSAWRPPRPPRRRGTGGLMRYPDSTRCQRSQTL